MGIAGGQRKSPQPLQLGVAENGLHESEAIAFTPALGHNKDVYQVGKGRAVRDHAGKGHLLVVDKSAKAKRVVDGFLQRMQGDIFGPCGLRGQNLVNERDIQFALVGANAKICHAWCC